MKRLALFVAFGLATAGSTALAEQADRQIQAQNPKPQPVKMTDAQMDNVAGGQALIDVDIRQVANNIQVQVPVNANVGVLSGPQLATQFARAGLLGRVTP
jgi:hypothetical protein